MRCPLRMKGFDQPDTCDPECAWAIGGGDKVVCAVAAIVAHRMEMDRRMPTINSQEIGKEGK